MQCREESRPTWDETLVIFHINLLGFRAYSLLVVHSVLISWLVPYFICPLVGIGLVSFASSLAAYLSVGYLFDSRWYPLILSRVCSAYIVVEFIFLFCKAWCSSKENQLLPVIFCWVLKRIDVRYWKERIKIAVPKVKTMGPIFGNAYIRTMDHRYQLRKESSQMKRFLTPTEVRSSFPQFFSSDFRYWPCLLFSKVVLGVLPIARGVGASFDPESTFHKVSRYKNMWFQLY